MQFKHALLSFFIFTLSQNAWTADIDSCGEVGQITGSSCTDLKVEFDLKKCESRLDKVQANVVCNNKEASASFKTDKYNYRLVLENTETWGTKSFAAKGKIWRAIRKNYLERKTAADKPEIAETKIIEPKKVPASTTPAIPEWINGLTVSGSVDFYYAFNYNTPADSDFTTPYDGSAAAQNKYHLFDYYHNNFQMSYARLLVQKSAEPLGVTVDLAYGPAMDAVSGTGTDSSQRNLKQAYITYKKGAFTLDAGRFVTHMGYEVIEAQDNWNYTRSILFGYPIPFWHNGIRLNYAVSDKVLATGYVLNGWGNSYDNNTNKTFGTQIAWTVNDSFSTIFNVLHGDEEAEGVEDLTKSVYELILNYKWSNTFKVAADIIHYSAEQSGGSNKKTFGTALYALCDFDEKWSFSPRIEYVNDEDNLSLAEATITGQTLWTYTATLEHRPVDGLKVRLEHRLDKSDESVFDDKKNQNVTILSGIASF